MLATVASWFTPTSLFVTINIVIATIVIISRFSHQKTPPDPLLGTINSAQLVRAPSLLYRVKSFNFSLLSFDGHAHEDELGSDSSNQLVRAPSILNRLMSGNLSSLYRSEQITHSETETVRLIEPELRDLKSNLEQKIIQEVKRSNSDSSGEVLTTAPAKMMKSASEKMGKNPVEEIEMRRPSTARVDKRGSIGEVEEEIDAKADDFINRFKQQLKLQRLDSLLRYREMLKRK